MQQLCQIHNEVFTNICLDANCFTPLCPDCIEVHRRDTQHSPLESIKVARVQCSKKVRQCIADLTRIVELAQMPNQNDQYAHNQIQILEEHKQQILRQVNCFFEDVRQEFQQQLSQMHRGNALLEIANRITQLIFQLESLASRLDKLESLRSVYLLNSELLIKTARTQAYNQITQVRMPRFGVSPTLQSDLENTLKGVFRIQIIQEALEVEQPRPQDPIPVLPGYDIVESNYFDRQAQPKILPIFKGDTKEFLYIDFARLPNIPQMLSTQDLKQEFKIPLFHQSVVTKSGEIYLIGGVIPDHAHIKSQVIYQFVQNNLEQVGRLKIARSSHQLQDYKLQQVGSLQVARSSHGCVIVDRSIYCISGIGNDSQFTKSCEKFDIILKRTVNIQDCRHASSSCLVVKFNDFLYKFGGVDVFNQPIRVIERYSLANRNWSEINPQLTRPDGDIIRESGLNCYSCGLQISSNSLLIFGGYQKERSVDTTFIFSDAENTHRIIKVNEIKLPQSGGFWQQQAVIFDGQLYALQKEDSPESLQGVRMIKFNGTQWL